ncbi:MAG: YHS domain-containing protein [Calditrichaeota bacterium]|nr:MAG: YHS domain-containing protein [Calditrichota bacterium]
MNKNIDPVCGKRINVNKAHIVIHFEGEDYLLCCPQCQKEFETQPRKYARKKQKNKGR